jgi:hypothetical protein
MADRTAELQAAVVATLRSDAALQALIPEATLGAHVYDRAPQGVFADRVTLGATVAEPVDAQGLSGWRCVLTLDVWSRAYGASTARQIMAAVHGALHERSVTLSAGAFVWAQVIDQRTMSEDHGETTHGVIRLDCMTDG